jgi:hypothetical protein
MVGRATVETVLGRSDQMIEKGWACTLKEDEEAILTARTILTEEILEEHTTQATTIPIDHP